MPDKRRRYQFRFWLDITKPDELAIGQELETLKKRRQFARTIRDALRLFVSLSRGDVSVLRELFPAVVAELETSKTQPATGDLIQAITTQTLILERLAAGNSNGDGHTAERPALPAPELPSPFVAASVDPDESRRNFAASLGNLFSEDNDDLIEIQPARGNGQQIATNFLSSLAAIVED